MASTVRIPTPLRQLTDGEGHVTVEGETVGEVIAALDELYPGVAERVLDDDGAVKRFVNIFVRDEDIRFQDGLDTDVGEDEVVSIIPAVAGGGT